MSSLWTAERAAGARAAHGSARRVQTTAVDRFNPGPAPCRTPATRARVHLLSTPPGKPSGFPHPSAPAARSPAHSDYGDVRGKQQAAEAAAQRHVIATKIVSVRTGQKFSLGYDESSSLGGEVFCKLKTKRARRCSSTDEP